MADVETLANTLLLNSLFSPTNNISSKSSKNTASSKSDSGSNISNSSKSDSLNDTTTKNQDVIEDTPTDPVLVYEAPTNSTTEQISSGQKWWAAILLGIIFLIVSSPLAYLGSSSLSVSLGGMPLANGGPNIPGLLLHTAIFILIVRLILW